jgi:RhtB (resistance to homoserine/threonine) family protein
MFGIVHYETFLLAGILLNLTPGNDTIYILTKSIGQGRKAGIISVLGIGTGCLIHTILAAFGLSIIIAKSILLFNIIKYAGAAYLLYLGFKMLRNRLALNMADIAAADKMDYLKIYRDGILTNVLNPKVALFFIAFLPQFINPASKSTVLPFLALGGTFVTTGTLWCMVVAVFASAIFGRLKTSRIMTELINKACGITLIGLGIKVALTNRK